MAKPVFRVTAVCKSSKQKIDVGVLFESKFGYNLVLSDGAKITLTKNYDKEQKKAVPLSTYVIVEKDSHFINVNSTEQNVSASPVGSMKELPPEIRGVFDKF